VAAAEEETQTDEEEEEIEEEEELEDDERLEGEAAAISEGFWNEEERIRLVMFAMRRAFWLGFERVNSEEDFNLSISEAHAVRICCCFWAWAFLSFFLECCTTWKGISFGAEDETAAAEDEEEEEEEEEDMLDADFDSESLSDVDESFRFRLGFVLIEGEDSFDKAEDDAEERAAEEAAGRSKDELMMGIWQCSLDSISVMIRWASWQSSAGNDGASFSTSFNKPRIVVDSDESVSSCTAEGRTGAEQEDEEKWVADLGGPDTCVDTTVSGPFFGAMPFDTFSVSARSACHWARAQYRGLCGLRSSGHNFAVCVHGPIW
jgi:hypothetical protein